MKGERPARPIEIVTFCSLKGGVGKSTLAVACAMGRAAAGNAVLLVDGDLTGTSLADALALRRSSQKAVCGIGVYAHVDRGSVEGVLAAHTVTTLSYLLPKHSSRSEARRLLRHCIAVFTIAPVDGDTLEQALKLDWGATPSGWKRATIRYRWRRCARPGEQGLRGATGNSGRPGRSW